MKQSQTLKNHPEWEGIIEKEEADLKIEKSLKFALSILSHYLDAHKAIEKSQIELLWKLVSSPS